MQTNLGTKFVVVFRSRLTRVDLSSRFSPCVENEQGDAGRDGRTRLARPNSQARTETGKIENIIFPVQSDHKQDWQPYPFDLYSAEISADYPYRLQAKYCYIENTNPIITSSYLVLIVVVRTSVGPWIQ